MFLLLLGIYVGMELPNTAGLFCQVTAPFSIPTWGIWGLQFLNNFTNTCDYLLDYNHPHAPEVVFMIFAVWRSYLFVYIFQFMKIYWLTSRYQTLPMTTHSWQAGNRRPLYYSCDTNFLICLCYHKREIKSSLLKNLSFDYLAILEMSHTSIYMQLLNKVLTIAILII